MIVNGLLLNIILFLNWPQNFLSLLSANSCLLLALGVFYYSSSPIFSLFYSIFCFLPLLSPITTFPPSLWNFIFLFHPTGTFFFCCYTYKYLTLFINSWNYKNEYNYYTATIIQILSLGVGVILIGGFWAFQEFNWGGWWAGDFIEVSLLLTVGIVIICFHYLWSAPRRFLLFYNIQGVRLFLILNFCSNRLNLQSVHSFATTLNIFLISGLEIGLYSKWALHLVSLFRLFYRLSRPWSRRLQAEIGLVVVFKISGVLWGYLHVTSLFLTPPTYLFITWYPLLSLGFGYLSLVYFCQVRRQGIHLFHHLIVCISFSLLWAWHLAKQYYQTQLSLLTSPASFFFNFHTLLYSLETIPVIYEFWHIQSFLYFRYIFIYHSLHTFSQVNPISPNILLVWC